MEIAFFCFLVLSIYPYAVYPLLLWIFSHLFADPWRRTPGSPLRVSMIISAYNEEKVIRDKVENALALDYPEEMLEVIVSSDGSTDDTNAIVSRFEDPRLVLQKFERLGKTACLNRVVPKAKGEVILFTDANSMFPSDILHNITANFADPGVGLVTGWTKYVKAGGNDDVTGLYGRLEKNSKYRESLVSSCVGADGAVFAIRKSLYRPLDAGDINDFIIPLRVIEQNKRVVLDPEVFCREEPVDGDENAYRRQVRITTRTLWAIRRNLGFLNFKKYGFFSFFLLSHKILRLAVPFFLIAAFAANVALLGQAWFYNVVFGGFLVFFGAAGLSFLGILSSGIASVCKYFLITFSAQFMGWLRMATGITDSTWTPKR